MLIYRLSIIFFRYYRPPLPQGVRGAVWLHPAHISDCCNALCALVLCFMESAPHNLHSRHTSLHISTKIRSTVMMRTSVVMMRRQWRRCRKCWHWRGGPIMTRLWAHIAKVCTSSTFANPLPHVIGHTAAATTRCSRSHPRDPMCSFLFWLIFSF